MYTKLIVDVPPQKDQDSNQVEVLLEDCNETMNLRVEQAEN